MNSCSWYYNRIILHLLENDDLNTSQIVEKLFDCENKETNKSILNENHKIKYIKHFIKSAYCLLILMKSGFIFKNDYNRYTLNDNVKRIHDDTLDIDADEETKKSNQEYLFNWTLDIIDKEYSLYSWNDEKIQSILTIDASLMVGLFVVLQVKNLSNIKDFIVVALLFLLASIFICVVHSVPKLNSKIGNELNLRTMIGIKTFISNERFFKNSKAFLAKDQYLSELKEYNVQKMLEDNASQIVGLCKNNYRSHLIILIASILTMIGIASVAFMLVMTLF